LRDVLRPLGLHQKGQSRLWIDDHGWWLIVVEFQPSAWSQGSYLNVAPMWLWKRSEHYSFDTEGARAHEHIEFRDETQFAAAAQQLAELAKSRVLELREQFPTLDAVAKHLRATRITHGGWREYDAGVVAALTGDATRARTCFDAILSADRTHDSDFWKDMRRQVSELRDRCDDRNAVRQWASGVVADSRRLLKLEALSSAAFA
jgi:hypothetical protein